MELGQPQGFTESEWGDLALTVGDAVEATVHYRKAIELLEAEVARRPETMLNRRELADAYERMGALQAGSHKIEEARRWYAKSLEVWRSWTTWGVSSPYNERRELDAAALLARYSAIR